MSQVLQILLSLSFLSVSSMAGAQSTPLAAPQMSSVFQLGANTDAFSSVTSLGNGIFLAGKRSWNHFAPNLAIYRSTDFGKTWKGLANPVGITGAHVYFFGANEQTVLVGTGDTGNVSLMRSSDLGATWNVVLSADDIADLSGSDSVAAVFSPLYFGGKRWLVNLRNDLPGKTSNIYFLESLDDGLTWHPFKTKGLNCSARKVMKASDGTLVYSGFSGGIWTSNDDGATWTKRKACNAFSGQADLGGGTYLVGTYDSGSQPTTISILKSTDFGVTWTVKKTVSVPSATSYFRSLIQLSGQVVVAYASSSEFEQNDRQARTYISYDQGETWQDKGAPFINEFGNMNAIYDAVMIDRETFLAVAQPDSTILMGKFTVPLR